MKTEAEVIAETIYDELADEGVVHEQAELMAQQVRDMIRLDPSVSELVYAAPTDIDGNAHPGVMRSPPPGMSPMWRWNIADRVLAARRHRNELMRIDALSSEDSMPI